MTPHAHCENLMQKTFFHETKRGFLLPQPNANKKMCHVIFESGNFLEISFLAVFGCFWLFLAVFGPLWACLGQGGNFIIHQMGWGLFSNGWRWWWDTFCDFWGVFAASKHFSCFPNDKKWRFKAIFGAARGQAVLARKNENHQSMATGALPGAPMAPWCKGNLPLHFFYKNLHARHCYRNPTTIGGKFCLFWVVKLVFCAPGLAPLKDQLPCALWWAMGGTRHLLAHQGWDIFKSGFLERI